MKLRPGELGATLFDLVPCAVVVVDRDYNIIAANPAFQERYGHWEGSHCYEIFKRQHRPCHRCAALETFRDGQVHITEERGFDKEGKPTVFEVKTAPLFDAEGKVEHVLEMTVDISQVRNLESRYQLLFERVPCFITVLDRDYRIIDANWRHRQTSGEAEGLCYQVYMQAARPCVDCPVRRTLDDGRVHTRQKELLDKRGQPIHVIVHTAPLYDQSGQIESVIEMATDITPMVEMQKKLLHAEGDAAMDRAIQVLKTTLEQLLGSFAELSALRDTPELPESSRARQALDRVQLRLEHLTSLLALMRDHGRPSGTPAGPVPMGALLEQVLALLGSRAGTSGLRLRAEVDDGLDPAAGDALLLRDCLACLVYDFLEICPPHPHGTECVVLSAGATADDRLQLRIHRQGLGLLALDETPALGEGMSLGLLVVKRLLEAAGGTVEFSSPKGGGIWFEVSLPVHR